MNKENEMDKLETMGYMQRWEYKAVATGLSTEDLNELGENGWEMCGVKLYQMSCATTFYFKRPKQYEKRTATLNIKPVHTELVTDRKREKEIEEEIKNMHSIRKDPILD